MVTDLSYSRVTATTCDVETNRHGCILIKLYLHRAAARWIWPILSKASTWGRHSSWNVRSI